MHIAQKFEHLLDTYRRPDGHRWTGQQLDEATGGVVRRSYVTNLRKGRIENPGYEKMRAIAKAMGFAPEVWFEDGLGQGRSIGQGEESRRGTKEPGGASGAGARRGEPRGNTQITSRSLARGRREGRLAVELQHRLRRLEEASAGLFQTSTLPYGTTSSAVASD